MNDYKFKNRLWALIPCFVLLIWFTFDMTGLYINGKPLVEQAFSDDWMFFFAYLAAILLFIFLDKIGKYILDIWLLMWFITQFFSHWFFTITGEGLKKNEYFKNTVKLISSETRYIPDLYHIILHILILIAFTFLTIFIAKGFKKKNKEIKNA